MKQRGSILLAAILLLTLAAGCGPKGGKEDASELVIGQAADVSALDPQLSNAIASVSVYGNMFDTLTRIDENNTVVPHLAESWEQVNDTTTVFHLRKDVTFSNGEKLTSADVAFTIERVIDSPYVSYALDFIDHVEATDEYTVTVYTKEAFGPILAHFSIPYTGIVPKSEVEKDEAAFSAHPIGSGAYRLVEWKPGEEKNDKLQVINQESMAVMYLTVNQSKGGPLADANVRKAMELAIDKQAIIDAVAYGYGSQAASVAPPICIGYSDNIKPAQYDLEQAKEYMAKSGYPDGFTCKLWTSDDSIRIEASNIIQNQLAQINIDAKIEILEYGTLLSALDQGDHDLVYERWTTDSGDAYYTLYALYNSTCTPYEGNDAFYVNPAVDQYIQEARQMFDIAQRTEKFEQVYAAAAEDLPYIPVYYPYNSVAMSTRVQGFTLNPNGAHQLRLISVA